MKTAQCFSTALAAGLVLAQGSSPAATVQHTWNFTVYLNDASIGHHQFTVTEDDAGRKVRSEARFEVKFLLFKAYSYAHRADETWRGDCLAELQAYTNDNGEQIIVNGAVLDGRFKLRRDQVESTLPACVMTFAYWHPRLVEQRRLLNPQTGEYTDVHITLRGQEPISVRGKPVNARRYHLEAGKFQIELWYAEGQQWVALDSPLDNGRRLRYRIE
jgi:hypothetical protein